MTSLCFSPLSRIVGVLVGLSLGGCITKGDTNVNGSNASPRADEDAGARERDDEMGDDDETSNEPALAAEPEPNNEPDTGGTGPQMPSAQDEEVQPAAEPQAEPAAEPQAEPAAEPQAEPAAEPQAEPEPSTNGGGGSGGEPSNNGGMSGESSGSTGTAGMGGSGGASGAECSATNVVEVTSDLAGKAYLGVARRGEDFLVAFVSKPSGIAALSVATVDEAGELGPRHVLAEGDQVPNDVWSQTYPGTRPVDATLRESSQDFLVAWRGHDGAAYVQAVGSDAVPLDGPTIVNEGGAVGGLDPTGVVLSWNDGVTYAVWGGLGSHLLPDVGGVLTHSTGMGTFVTQLAVGEGFAQISGFGGTSGWVGLVDLDGTEPIYNPISDADSMDQGNVAAAWDGEAIQLVGLSGYWQLTYDRVALGGDVGDREEIETVPQGSQVVSAVFAPERPGGGAVAALPTTGTVLRMVERSVDGTQTRGPVAIVGGSEISHARAFWNGTEYVVFWLEAVDGVKQVKRAKVLCE